MIEKQARRRASARTKHAAKRTKRFRRVNGQAKRERAPQPWKPPAELPPFEPMPRPTDLQSAFRATEHRFRARACDGALARQADGRPTLPEMTDAAYWSLWGSWFAEVADSGLTPSELFDGETRLRAAYGAVVRKYGTRQLSKDEQLEMFEYLLADPLAKRSEG